MGIYDREYYRDDSRGSGWFSGVAPACKTIIVVNVVLFFVFWSAEKSPFREALEANSDDIFKHGKIWQLFTAAFLHDTHSVLHVGWNMLFLWMFGREVESIYGSREFTFFYISAAVFSAFCWAVVDRLTPGAGLHNAVGASGAVMAVVMVYVLYYPHREMLLFLVLPVEAWMFLAVYLGYDAVLLLQQLQGMGVGPAFAVGFAAHLGGATYGYLYKRFDLRLSHLLSRKPRRPRLRIVSPPPRERERSSPLPATSSRSAAVGSAAKGPSPSAFPEEQLDARLDEVLAKIAREGGKSGLTEEEHRILEEASRRARDRRSDRP